VFLAGSVISIVMVLIYTHLGRITLPMIVVVNVLMFLGIFSRMIPFQALASSVPSPSQRGAFTAVSASIQQLSGGLAAVLAGHIVSFGADGKLQNFDLVGYVIAGTSLVSLVLVWYLDGGIRARAAAAG
jgi:hypothetical protein